MLLYPSLGTLLNKLRNHTASKSICHDIDTTDFCVIDSASFVLRKKLIKPRK